MRLFIIPFTVIIILIFSACSGGKYAHLARMGDQAYQEKDYMNALDYAVQNIAGLEQKGKKAEGSVYALAGKSAWELGKYDISLDYLEQARSLNYSDDEMYVCLSDCYQKIDNLSKEITALEYYIRNYPGAKDIDTMRARLFKTCLESENFMLADSLWPLLEVQNREDPGTMTIYLKICQATGKELLCDSLSKAILDKDPENEPAMKWLGEKFFWQAEKRYQAEMDAYEKKRTNSQYAKLLEAFKTVTKDFKTSLGYFNKLYKLYPKAEYAQSLGNIYTRLDDQEKAKYYYNKAK